MTPKTRRILSNGSSARTVTTIITKQIKNKPFWTKLSLDARVAGIENIVIAIYDLLVVLELCKTATTKRRERKK